MSLLKLQLLKALTNVPVLRHSARKAAKKIAKGVSRPILSTIFTGQKMLLSVTDWVQYHLYLYGFYELPESLFWLNYTRNKKVVFDVGGNVGYFSLLASKNMAPSGKIYAFEPVSHTFNRFQENLQLNGVNNVVLEKMAISNRLDELTLNVGNESNWGMSSINEHDQISGRKEIVACETIDHYLATHKIEQLDIIKIDIEGSEYAAIEGMQQTITKLRPVVLIELLDAHLTKQGVSSADIYNLFWKEGYTAYEIQKNNELTKLETSRSFDGLICFYPSEKPLEPFMKIKNA